jgi:MoaA/NifB/PqqE/SkfB family radical SAM enzyme
MIATAVIKAVILNALGITQYPGFITYFVTWRCNGRCNFCDVWKKRTDYSDELTVPEIIKIFRQLKKIQVLRLSGGEPFLRKDIADIVNGIDEVNAPGVIHFTTNGLLTERIIESVQAMKPAKKIHIKVSIDNIGAKHDENRGVPGAYEKAMATVKGLCALREKYGFHVGVNQGILDQNEIDSYYRLRDLLAPLGVPVFPSIAIEPTNSLYSNTGIVDPSLSYKTFGHFSEEKLKEFMAVLVEDGKKVGDLQEQMVDRYHLKGLYNRMVLGKRSPHPECVALNNHMRLLPNGDVPVCLYNSEIVGNLRDQDFKTVWFGEKAKSARKWVHRCKGCWQSCESAVSAIYTGDIWKGLFY